MIFYEIKKVFSRMSSRIALLLLLATLILTCFLAVGDVSYVNEYGETETGIHAIQKLKAAKQAWRGPLTEEKLAAVIEENIRIIATEEYQADDLTMNQIAYSWMQGISDIRDLINRTFGRFREWNYYLINSLTPAVAPDFYERRISQLEEWLYSEGDGADSYTDAEKEFIVDRYKTLETPFYYDDTDGWQTFFLYFNTISMITMLILGFLVTEIFSAEFTQKADAVFFSSYHGRKRAVMAKIGAGIVITTAIYWLMTLLYAAVVLGIVGTEGADLAIQINTDGWRSLHHLTNRQEFWLVIIGGYIGNLVFALLTMLVSAKTRNPVLAVIVPFVLLFIRSFVEIDRLSIGGKIMEFFPDQLLQVNNVISTFSLCDFGGKVVLSLNVMLVFYPILILLLLPVLYRIYSRAQIK